MTQAPFCTDEPDDVASPCVKTCRLDERFGWCAGCGRTIEEIVSWPRAGKAEKEEILKRLSDRLKSLEGQFN